MWKVQGPRRIWKFRWGWLIVERGWGRIKGLGRCWKFKWGWLIVERGWRRVKGLGGCCKFKWGEMKRMETLWAIGVKGSGD